MCYLSAALMPYRGRRRCLGGVRRRSVPGPEPDSAILEGMRTTRLWRILAAVAVLAITAMLPHRAQATALGCGQAQVERLLGAAPPPGPTAYVIHTRKEITPFYQWESNDGYCGETSLISAGLIHGQWMSQFNARLVCGAFFGPESDHGGASLLQAGNPVRTQPNYNAQLLIESPGTGVSGDYDFAHAALCGANSRLLTLTYPYPTGYVSANVGMSGYQDYMRWIKAQVLAGNQVTVAVLFNGGTDAQYDHEVSVLEIGTNHSPQDAEYYDDDVLYFEDHGAYTLSHRGGTWDFAWNPAVPPGAGANTVGCTPYVFAYRFVRCRTRAPARIAGRAGLFHLDPGASPHRDGERQLGPRRQLDGPHSELA